MGANEMVFECGNVRLELYRDDDGMYRVYKSFTDRPGDGYTVGTAFDRPMAFDMLHAMIFRETRAWVSERS